MAELACNMVYVYLAGEWSWLNRATAARKRLAFRECTLEMGHACSHTPAYPPTMTQPDPLPEREEQLDEMAGYRVPTYTERDRLRAEPDPERDRRRAAYKALEREQARRALDDWFQAVDAKDWPGANELMSRLMAQLGDYTKLPLHHKGNYGVPDMLADPGPQTGPTYAEMRHAPDAAHDERARHRDRERAVTPASVGILPNAFRCTGCSFTTADGGRMKGHMDATGHAPEGHYGATKKNWCECDWLGEGTPRHAPSPMCRSLRPDGPRSA